MIRLSHVCAKYPEKTVFKDITLAIPDNGTIALMAPSGYGKTTLLRILAGLLPIEHGTVSGLINKKISFLFQEDRLLPWLTAEKNVALVSDQAMAVSWLKKMEIDNLRLLPHEMSGGMQRRVALARAMAFGGDVLLLDEPFKGLDEALRTRIAERIRNQFPLTILSVHDVTEAESMGAQVVLLERLTQE